MNTDREQEDVQPRPAVGRYAEILESFGAREKSAAESIAHLVSLGFHEGQARNAVYRFRQRYVRRAESSDSRRGA